MRWKAVGWFLVALLSCATARPDADPVAELRRAIDEGYSYRDLHHVDWEKLLNDFSPRLRAASPREFARVAAELLSSAEDVHITVKLGAEAWPTTRKDLAPNYNRELIAKLVPDVKSDRRCVSFGHSADGIGYISVGAWNDDCATSAQHALDMLSDQHALVVDVRPNMGGNDALAKQFAARFVDKATRYAFIETLTANGFGPRQTRVVEPDVAHRCFLGKVAVLMGPRNMSSNESFLLMMHAAGATLVGERSYGSSGNPQPHRLSNGIIVSLPSWREYRLDGVLIEGRGIDPDIRVDWPSTVIDDPVLRTALDGLRT